MNGVGLVGCLSHAWSLDCVWLFQFSMSESSRPTAVLLGTHTRPTVKSVEELGGTLQPEIQQTVSILNFTSRLLYLFAQIHKFQNVLNIQIKARALRDTVFRSDVLAA